MSLCNVTVYTQYVHSDGSKDAVFEEFVSATSADHGEIVAALQVLYPTYVGCLIELVDEEPKRTLHDYSGAKNA